RPAHPRRARSGRRAALRGLVPRCLDAGRPCGLRGLPASRHVTRGRADRRRRPLRADAAEANVSTPLPRESPLGLAERGGRRPGGARDRRARPRRRRVPICRSRAHANHVKRERSTRMTTHTTGTREEWLAARLELLEAEKELTRRGDELAQQRRELPWVEV